MQRKGWKTCVVERNRVEGRDQEWNISKKELAALVRLGLMTDEEIQAIISIEFNPVRVGFHTDTSNNLQGQKGLTAANGFNLYAEDILNIGVKV